MITIKNKYPVSLYVSGIIEGLLLNFVPGLVGLCFLVFGFLGSFLLFKVAGALVIAFYLVVSILHPFRTLSQIEKEISGAELDAIVDDSLHSEGKSFLSAFDRVTAAVDKKGNAYRTAPENDDPGSFSQRSGDAPQREYDLPARRRVQGAGPAGFDPRRIIVSIFGVVFFLGGIYFFVTAVNTYSQQLAAKDWTVATATVTDVHEREEYNSSRSSSRKYITVYDIGYQYDSDSGSHLGRIVGTKFYKAPGETFSIKYDPEAPENSTDITELQTGALIVNLAMSCAFMAIGLWAMGLFQLLFRFRKRGGSLEG